MDGKQDPKRAYRRPKMPFEREAAVAPSATRWSAVGIEFALWVALLVLAGRWLDDEWGWAPWGTAAGGLLGASLGTYALIRRVLRASRDGEGEP